jgi:hypothetical protein
MHWQEVYETGDMTTLWGYNHAASAVFGNEIHGLQMHSSRDEIVHMSLGAVPHVEKILTIHFQRMNGDQCSYSDITARFHRQTKKNLNNIARVLQLDVCGTSLVWRTVLISWLPAYETLFFGMANNIARRILVSATSLYR